MDNGKELKLLIGFSFVIELWIQTNDFNLFDI